jgi:hypothetical protein
VLPGQFGVRILAAGDRVQNVALGQDTDASMLGIHHHRRPHMARRHHARRLPQRMRGPDGQDKMGHAVPHLHEEHPQKPNACAFVSPSSIRE